MNSDVIADLKQFIEATVSQAMANLATKDDLAALNRRVDGLEQNLTSLDQKLDDRIDEVLEAVGEIIHANVETIYRQLADHETRITKLEAHTV
ncbi:MAG: hypothetical protein WBP12_04580 [Candidatus Saccharimonas sp.]